ncbi:hypothetical protein BC830DRAFT_1121937 [Chytriomyces sp. MP71]|nr:hypothetical protein BC830DRAFT_1121937 [Chytriomyces sp. MP71]
MHCKLSTSLVVSLFAFFSHASPVPLHRRQTAEQNAIAALQAAQVGQSPDAAAAINNQIQGLLNHQAGTTPGVSANQNQIAALQNSLTGLDPATQAAVMQQIQNLMNQQAGTGTQTWNGYPTGMGWNGVNWNGWNGAANWNGANQIGWNGMSGWNGVNWNGNGWNGNNMAPGMNSPSAANCAALTGAIQHLQNAMNGADANTQSGLMAQQQALMNQMVGC